MRLGGGRSAVTTLPDVVIVYSLRGTGRKELKRRRPTSWNEREDETRTYEEKEEQDRGQQMSWTLRDPVCRVLYKLAR